VTNTLAYYGLESIMGVGALTVRGRLFRVDLLVSRSLDLQLFIEKTLITYLQNKLP
jgi:hypothetical protein